jgi:hypothetical protein
LYVGKARNLRDRLGSYRVANPERQPRRLVRLLFRVERIFWDVCESEEAAAARERQLLRVLQPRFNRRDVYPPVRYLRPTPVAETLGAESSGSQLDGMNPVHATAAVAVQFARLPP